MKTPKEVRTLAIGGFVCRVTMPRMTHGPWDKGRLVVNWTPRVPREGDLSSAQHGTVKDWLANLQEVANA